jgi:hypothetical protein
LRIVSRTTRSALEQRREESLRRRTAAGTIRRAFPHVDLVRVQLRFGTGKESAPSAQLHALHAPAPASFEFSCPIGDCDGIFDLNSAVRPLLEVSGNHAEGHLECSGTRAHGGAARRPCRLRLEYRISALYRLRG